MSHSAAVLRGGCSKGGWRTRDVCSERGGRGSPDDEMMKMRWGRPILANFYQV